VYLPAIDCDKALLARIVLTEKLAAGSECFLQSALLYTNVAGQRVIRVHTLALPVTDNISTVFKGADLDAQVRRSVARCGTRRPLLAQPPRV
jgi:protein transport protein SEC24